MLRPTANDMIRRDSIVGVVGIVLIIISIFIIPPGAPPGYRHCIYDPSGSVGDTDPYQYSNLSDDGQRAVRLALNQPNRCWVTTNESERVEEFRYVEDAFDYGYGLYVIIYEGETYELETTRDHGDSYLLFRVFGVVIGLLLVGYSARTFYNA